MSKQIDLKLPFTVNLEKYFDLAKEEVASGTLTVAKVSQILNLGTEQAQEFLSCVEKLRAHYERCKPLNQDPHRYDPSLTNIFVMKDLGLLSGPVAAKIIGAIFEFGSRVYDVLKIPKTNLSKVDWKLVDKACTAHDDYLRMHISTVPVTAKSQEYYNSSSAKYIPAPAWEELREIDRLLKANNKGLSLSEDERRLTTIAHNTAEAILRDPLIEGEFTAQTQAVLSQRDSSNGFTDIVFHQSGIPNIVVKNISDILSSRMTVEARLMARRHPSFSYPAPAA